MDNRPVGFMDSGVGGLTVVKMAQKLLPNEEIVFIGDEARMPYGPRPTEEVVEFSKQMAAFLISKNVKALVIACNTATSAAYEILQKELSIPVIGVILPGAMAAAEQTKNNKVGVIATLGTIKSNIYPKTLKTIQYSIESYPLACQEFVEIAEKNELDTPETRVVVENKLKEFKQDQIDTLILGCTHFPLLSKNIQRAVGDEVTLIDPGVETSKQLKNLLEDQDMLRDEKLEINDRYYSTGNLVEFENVARNFLEKEIVVQQVKID
ncbi:glutamate racemase [Pediococcus stilesii]|uniref:Glutamate racemase n=1 Tax=Pediococcus stilesii TaxID=331679 RepID=A0A5R9BXF4_9LACO|nr:glutamate racemase [Pediococcus stilesii]TLQ05414.1 glutamate racemase [Pediococcus stilesii]